LHCSGGQNSLRKSPRRLHRSWERLPARSGGHQSKPRRHRDRRRRRRIGGELSARGPDNARDRTDRRGGPIGQPLWGCEGRVRDETGKQTKQLRVECIAFRRVMRGPMAVWTERKQQVHTRFTFLRAENVMNVQETTISSVVRADEFAPVRCRPILLSFTRRASTRFSSLRSEGLRRFPIRWSIPKSFISII